MRCTWYKCCRSGLEEMVSSSTTLSTSFASSDTLEARHSTKSKAHTTMSNGSSLFESTSAAEKICPFSGARSSSRTPTPDSVYTATRTSRDSASTAATSEIDLDNLSLHEEQKCPVIFTQEVDPLLIKNSLEDRVAYLTDFLNFTSHDSDVIQNVAPHVNAIIPGLVDDLYAKLFEFDITKKVFMTRNQVCSLCSALARPSRVLTERTSLMALGFRRTVAFEARGLDA